MNIPTDEEIKTALDGITAAGPLSEDTIELAYLILRHPDLKGAVYRIASGSNGNLEPAITGAMMYGLHVGLRIADIRSGKNEYQMPIV